MEITRALVVLGWSHFYQLLALFCLAIVLYKLTVLLMLKRALIRNFESFPGPPGHWLFGNILEFKQDGNDLDKLVKFGQKYPYCFPLWFGPFVCFLNIHHPEYVKTILASTEPKDDLAYSFIQNWIGNGLLVSQGQKWFRHRRLLTPGFHYDVLKPYVKLMAHSTKTMLDKWESYAKTNKPLEVFEYVSLMTLDTILNCAFSYDSNCQTESPHGFRYRKACMVAHSHTEEVIKKRREALKKEKELERIQAKRNLDFLDILLFAKDENQQGLLDEDIRAEVDTFMFEGHDTTASGISFLLYNLACHPKHQKLCRKEIMQVLHGKDTMDWEDLNKIPYTTMCIKESLRMHPPVPGISRKTTKPITFFDGRTLPAESRIGTSVFGIHRNASIWENPNVFDPLRFLPENISKRPPHAFVPFSAGPRNCIGQNFAMNEMKVVIAMTLLKYELLEEPTLKPKIIPRLVLRSLNGIHIKIKNANQN
ncbi:cytochrome P450 4T8 isoform X2 [Takifugu rubripes]|uniref:cytochrome P450 4T8 isoform X2 n=1 Tax=Takifugu rubripes TaxID=31033 RepID=UPI0005D24311|nr:cytochrome P450 4B1-like isoform X2 [Takifugu rubripes]|eukprot:XP_011616494.1 PREDICTED: cytochrome P450 4B1-like isoform X2 [Takifugu rubripes]